MPPNTIAEEAEADQFYEDLRPSRTNKKKKNVLFIIEDWNVKVRSQEIPWKNRQVLPWNTKWSKAQTHRVWSRECTDHSQHPLPTTQEIILHTDITRWLTMKWDWVYSLQLKMETLYTVSRNTTVNWLCLRSWSLIAKFRFKLKKVGKITRPFRYDINQFSYDYTVEVMNILKGLDLVEGVPKELWMEVQNIVQEVVTKTITKKKKGNKAKWSSEEALQIAEKRREVKDKGERERYTN